MVAPASSHRVRSGGVAPRAKLVVIAALLPHSNLIMGAASQVGGDMAAGDVGGDPNSVTGPVHRHAGYGCPRAMTTGSSGLAARV